MRMLQNDIGQIWSLVGFFTLIRSILPPQLQLLLNQWLNQWWSYIFGNRFNPYYFFEIPQNNGSRGVNYNVVYEEVELYLLTLDAFASARKLTVSRSRDSSGAEFCPASDEAVVDLFQGATFWWSHNISYLGKDQQTERCRFNLKVALRSKPFLSAYFEHIANIAAELKRLSRGTTLFTNYSGSHRGGSGWIGVGGSGWSGVSFKHPSSFDSLALDPTLKNKIIRDLNRFRQGKEFHSRVGRPWKRGYLLYGPPGTGKSSLVAAIANYMKYNVYDLELTKVNGNSELRSLLIQTNSKSIIVTEDIDCSLDVANRVSEPRPNVEVIEGKERSGSQVTLSGLLNSTDGLWSCCAEEQIFIFTTNHKDKLDPALLRSGRMDMHIFLTFCAFPAFKYLAFNYLQIEDHPLFSAVEESMAAGAEMTPADISEILIEHLDDPDKALTAVISALNENKPSAISDSHEANNSHISGNGIPHEALKLANGH